MRILVTDGHYKHALGIVRALAPQHEVLVAAPRRLAMAAVSRHAAKRLVSPPSAERARLLGWLDREIPRHRIEQVMPVSAAACELLASHANRWPGTTIVLPSAEQMAVALDKRSTMAVAASIGIAVPRTAELESLDGLDRAAEEVGFPLVLKAPLEGRSGVAYVDRGEDLRAAVVDWMTENRSSHPPLLQQRIVGPALGVFATYQRGGCRRIMAHRRIREFPPSGGESTCCELSTDAEAIDAGRQLLDTLAWHGVAMVELKRHEADGRLYLMEINPKFWGSLDLALAAGADFPGDLARIAAGEELGDQPPPGGPLRFCWPLGNDLRYLVARPRSWRSVLADWLGGARTNLRASDPLPHLVELAGTLGRMARG
jgi:predicted ATP-grasp superfamily ATP-dependent carboligase